MKIIIYTSIFIFALTVLSGTPAQAGGVFCNSNQSAEYIRSFDRNSATDGADIVYYNMAGTVKLPPGLTLNLSNQFVFQRATVDVLDNPVLGGRRYASDHPVWLMPNAYLAYRQGRWAWFTGLETLGATAVRRWPEGLPGLDLAGKQAAGYGGGASAVIAADAGAAAAAAGASPAQSQAAAVAAGLDAGAFPSHSWLRGASSFLAWRQGVAWQFRPRFAAAIAGRLVVARQDLRGGAAGECTCDQYGHDLRGSSLLLVDVRQQALGYSGEACLDWFPADGVVLSLTCELPTPLVFRTAVRDGKDGGGRFLDGARGRLDLPQVWRFGIGWPAAPGIRLSCGMNWYREGSARMDLLDDPGAGIIAARDYGDTWEASAAISFQATGRLLWSAGVNLNQIGQRRAAVLDTSLPGAHAHCLSVGAGCRWQAGPRLLANVGLAWTGFAHPVEQADLAGDQMLRDRFAAAGVPINPRKRYDKRYLILAVGIEWRLPS
jgi:hypothetical protein